MKRTLFAIAALALMSVSGFAATILDDPLHGCSVSSGCTDNGTVTPISGTTNFGFSISPGPQTGTLFLTFLVPNNDVAGPFAVTGSASGTASLVGTWTSGTLAAFFGISASPTNPISAWLPSTQTLDPGATGYKVYEANMGTLTLNANPNFLTGPLFSTTGVPDGSIIAGFLREGYPGYYNWIATASSGGLFVNSVVINPLSTPEPSALVLIGTGLIGLAAVGRKLKNRSV